MYADSIAQSMKYAIDETQRRRKIQSEFNDENGIIPKTIIKEIRPPIRNSDDEISDILSLSKKGSRKELDAKIKDLEKQMRKAAKEFDFERAAELRDIIFELKAEL